MRSIMALVGGGRLVRSIMALVVLLLGMTACTPVVMPAGAAVTSPMLAEEELVMADGARLPIRSWRPAKPPQMVVLALHGFNQYSGYFAKPAAYWAGHGVITYAYDQRGFGAAPHRGLWPGNATLIGDLRQAVEVIRRRHPGLPLVLLGDSMGGAVAMAAFASGQPPRVDGLILVAPAVWGRASMPWYQNMALWIAVHTFPGGQMTGRGLGIQASDNVEMLRELGRDPLVIKQTRVDAVFGLVGLMDEAMAASSHLNGRVLVLYGDNDQLIPKEAITEMLRRMHRFRPHPPQVALYAEGWHMLLHDLQAEAVWRDILSWLFRPSAPLPSGADAVAARGLAEFSGLPRG